MTDPLLLLTRFPPPSPLPSHQSSALLACFTEFSRLFLTFLPLSTAMKYKMAKKLRLHNHTDPADVTSEDVKKFYEWYCEGEGVWGKDQQLGDLWTKEEKVGGEKTISERADSSVRPAPDSFVCRLPSMISCRRTFGNVNGGIEILIPTQEKVVRKMLVWSWNVPSTYQNKEPFSHRLLPKRMRCR